MSSQSNPGLAKVARGSRKAAAAVDNRIVLSAPKSRWEIHHEKAELYCNLSLRHHMTGRIFGAGRLAQPWDHLSGHGVYRCDTKRITVKQRCRGLGDVDRDHVAVGFKNRSKPASPNADGRSPYRLALKRPSSRSWRSGCRRRPSYSNGTYPIRAIGARL